MATAFSSVIAKTLRRYGLDPTADDPLLSNALLIDRINEVLQEAAEFGAFREEVALNLSATVSNYVLGVNVLRVMDRGVRVDYNGDGDYELQLEPDEEADLTQAFGPLPAVTKGEPAAYFLRRSNTVDSMLELVIFPGSDVARTNGLKVWVEVSPAVISTAAGTLPLQTAEERFLIPGLCLAMALVERAQGRTDAPVAEFAGLWEQAKDDWRGLLSRQLHGTGRRIRHTESHW